MARTTVYNHITTEEKIAEINENNTWLINEFLEYLASIDRAPQTLRSYKSDLHIFFVWNIDFNNNKDFVKLTKREIAKFQNYAINEWHWSPRRVRRVKSTLSSMSLFIENILDDEEGYENFRPIIKKIESPVNEAIREKTIFSDEQVELLMNTLVERKEYEKACAVAIAAYSGMRKAEILQMKMEYFNDDHLVFDCLYKTDKIRAKGRGQLGKQINKYVMKKVDKYLDLWKAERERLGINSEWVFVRRCNGNFVRRETLDNWTDEFSEIVGEDFYFHSLRHYVCSMLSANNLPYDQDSGSGLERPLEEYPCVHVVEVIFVGNELDQLQRHHKGENCACDGDDHGFRQVLYHAENAAVPCLRR